MLQQSLNLEFFLELCVRSRHVSYETLWQWLGNQHDSKPPSGWTSLLTQTKLVLSLPWTHWSGTLKTQDPMLILSYSELRLLCSMLRPARIEIHEILPSEKPQALRPRMKHCNITCYVFKCRLLLHQQRMPRHMWTARRGLYLAATNGNTSHKSSTMIERVPWHPGAWHLNISWHRSNQSGQSLVGMLIGNIEVPITVLQHNS